MLTSVFYQSTESLTLCGLLLTREHFTLGSRSKSSHDVVQKTARYVTRDFAIYGHRFYGMLHDLLSPFVYEATVIDGLFGIRL